jgi:uncharacterized repeat protein (TIGR03803 family)
MTNLGACRMAGAVLLLCAATAIGAQAQTFEWVNFDGADGTSPGASLVQGPDGRAYGTTVYGGARGSGSVFRITREGTLTTLYNFCASDNCVDGAAPIAGLVLGTDGSFYSTTQDGGDNGFGTVFKITPTGTLTNLHSFDLSDGAAPAQGLVQATDGDFYGTTLRGGVVNDTCPMGCGTIFKITPEGTLTTLHSFNSIDGANPQYGALIQAVDGNFYGTTAEGGDNGNYGTVFKITRDGILTTLHSFDSIDGASPGGWLVQATDGTFYGTTAAGGISTCVPYGCGTVFKITPGGALTTLYSFCIQSNCTDGEIPEAGLVLATDGSLYGTTARGGANSLYGTVFKIGQGGALTTLHSFNSTDGAVPIGGLVQATNGTFYGTTYLDGTNGDGTAFRLFAGLGPFVAFVRAAGRVGQTGPILGQGFIGTTGVSLNGTPASFTVVSDTFIRATVPAGATTGYVTVATPTGMLTSNVPFHVIP